MKNIYAGQSFYNGLMLSNRRYTVTATIKPGMTVMTLEIKKHPVGGGQKKRGNLLVGLIALIWHLIWRVPYLCLLTIFTHKQFKMTTIMALDFLMIYFVRHFGVSLGFSPNLILLGSFAFSICYMAVALTRDAGIYRAEGKKTETFQYHAAEHKVINTAEDGLELTLANVRKASRIHRRCGTNLMITKAILFPFAYLLTTVMFALPSISIAYVISSFVGVLLFDIPFLEHIPVLGLLIKAGNWFQKHVTTVEPADRHLALGIRAMEELQKATAQNSKSNVQIIGL